MLLKQWASLNEKKNTQKEKLATTIVPFSYHIHKMVKWAWLQSQQTANQCRSKSNMVTCVDVDGCYFFCGSFVLMFVSKFRWKCHPFHHRKMNYIQKADKYTAFKKYCFEPQFVIKMMNESICQNSLTVALQLSSPLTPSLNAQKTMDTSLPAYSVSDSAPCIEWGGLMLPVEFSRTSLSVQICLKKTLPVL